MFRNYGPFRGLEADEIKEEVDGMFRMLYKVSKQLYEFPGAKRVADMVRARVDKFKVLVPVLQAICNKVSFLLIHVIILIFYYEIFHFFSFFSFVEDSIQ